MANPKITLSVDQSILDTLSNLTAAINRLSDVLPAKPVPDEQSCTANTDRKENATVNPPLSAQPTHAAPITPVIPTTTTASAPVAPAMPVNPTVPPVNAPTAPIQTNTTPAVGIAPVASNPAAVVAQQPFGIPVAAPTTETPSVTLEQIMQAGVDLLSKGVNAATTLMEMGVQSVSELKPEQYPAMAARLRELGADI